MNLKAMNLFLSEENIKKHLDHLRTMKLKYSILEKSMPEIKGKSISEISKSTINRKVKNEALELFWYIKSHELFFNSFTENPTLTEEMRKQSFSKEKFIYDVICEAKEKNYGFLFVYLDKQGKIKTSFASEFEGAFVKYEPKLCMDLYEHTYFSDYGFQKEKFLRGAFGYFDTGRLKS